MSKLRIGILGCGKMGKVYAHWFSRHPHTQVVAFYNRTYSRAKDLAEKYPGSRAMSSWQELTEDPGVDIIAICTPSHEHLQQFTAAVRSGKHVLCEKPMARNAEECRQICEVAAASSVKVAVGFQMRFHSVIQKVDELLPRIGEIFHLDFVFGMYRPEVTWRHQSLQGGGVLMELGSHLIDLAIHWAGDISALSAQNRIISAPREVEDYSVNLLEFSSGAMGYLSCNYFDRRSRAIFGNLIGTTGQISWQFSSYDPQDSGVSLYTDSGKEEVLLDMPSENDIDLVYPGHLNSFGREIDHFVDCILNDKEPLAGPVEGRKAIEVIDASYRSTKQCQRIELPA